MGRLKTMCLNSQWVSLPAVVIFLLINTVYAQVKISPAEAIRLKKMIAYKHDSLLHMLKILPEDTSKVVTFLELSNVLVGLEKFDSGALVAKTAYTMALRLNEPKFIAKSLNTLGGCYGNTGARDYQKSFEYFHEGVKVAEANDVYDELHRLYSAILNLYFYSGDFPSAMDLTIKGLLSAEKKQDRKKITQYNNLLGFIYLRQGNINEAEKYYQQYFTLASEVRDSVTLADAYNCLAEISTIKKQYEKSLKYHFKALNIYTRHYLPKVKFRPDQLAYSAYRISHVYKIITKYDDALKYSILCFEFTHKHGVNEYDLVSYFHNASEIYKYKSEYKKSFALLHRALALSKKIMHKEDIRDSYFFLADMHKQIHQFDSAYHYQVLYAALKDSVVNESSQREIERIHAKSNIQKKDQAIAIQKAQLEWQHLQRDALIGTFIFLLVILFLLYNRYRLKQKNKFQAELTYQQNELFNTIVTFQDTERQRIAQDIHDTVGSVLSAAKLQLSALEELKNQFTEDHQEKYNAAMVLLDQATIELRNISHNIMPAALSRLGLVAALENLIDKISTYSGVNINFNVYGFKERLEEKTEIGIYPVVLELINNVLKHAQASQATVQLIRHPQYINITVEDNGKGFNVKTKKGKGIGLKNVMSRIQYLKGTIDIDSSEGQGTSIMIDIPY